MIAFLWNEGKERGRGRESRGALSLTVRKVSPGPPAQAHHSWRPQDGTKDITPPNTATPTIHSPEGAGRYCLK